VSNARTGMDTTTTTAGSPVEGICRDEERELADYFDALISATLARKTQKRPVGDRETGEPLPADPGAEEPHETTTCGPVPEPRDHEAKLSPSGDRARTAARPSMREGLMALFRSTERPPAHPSINPDSGAPATTTDFRSADAKPSPFFRRFLEQAARSPEIAPSGLAGLDARLSGGFGPGLHIVQGQSGVGKTAFLESVAWEAISSRRPVLYYAFRETGLGAWERLVSTFGHIMGGPTIPLDVLRARTLGPDDVETLTRLDATLQASVLPYLTLIETIPPRTDTLRAFVEDVSSRAQEAYERHGRIPLVLVDDLDRLLLLTRARRPLRLLSRLDDALAAESVPGLLAATLLDRSTPRREGLPSRTTLTLISASASANSVWGCVDLELRINALTSPAETLALLLDRRSGLFAHLPASADLDPVQ
jgi:hypothetical protein